MTTFTEILEMGWTVDGFRIGERVQHTVTGWLGTVESLDRKEGVWVKWERSKTGPGLYSTPNRRRLLKKIVKATEHVL